MMAMVLTIAKEGNVDVFSREFEELLEIGQRPQLVELLRGHIEIVGSAQWRYSKHQHII